MVAWVHRGPEQAFVTDVQVVEEPAQDERGFRLR